MLEITRPSAVPGGHWSGLSLVLNAYREKMKEKFRKISRFIDLVKRFDRAKGKSFEFRVLHRQNYSDFFHFIVNNKINKSSWIGMIELWNVIESLSVIVSRIEERNSSCYRRPNKSAVYRSDSFARKKFVNHDAIVWRGIEKSVTDTRTVCSPVVQNSYLYIFASIFAAYRGWKSNEPFIVLRTDKTRFTDREKILLFSIQPPPLETIFNCWLFERIWKILHDSS